MSPEVLADLAHLAERLRVLGCVAPGAESLFDFNYQELADDAQSALDDLVAALDAQECSRR